MSRDPNHPVYWKGTRGTFNWHVHDSYLDSLDLNWPCKPAMKVYGGRSNDVVQICMAPTADAFLARFDHDITFSTDVPVRWQRAGAFEVASFEHSPDRATFFARDPDVAGYDAPVEDEGARGRAPVMVLGPALYAVDLSFEVWRVNAREEFERLGGPGGGYAVYTTDGTLIRHGAGHLLGGWFRHATIKADDGYWREDLVTGMRTPLGRIDLRRCIDAADEAIARDAFLDRRFADVARIHDTHPSVTDEILGVLALPGTRQVVIVTPFALRVI